MYLMHIALGGCICAGPIDYGATEDTGGHITYLLGATKALSDRPDVSRIDIITRAFGGPMGETRYARPVERIDAKRRIVRLHGASDCYLEKDALEAELPDLTGAFLRLLQTGKRPDVIHAHFADAAQLALAAREAYGIPVLFSAHSLGRQKRGRSTAAHERRLAREQRAIETADAIICSSRDEAERQITDYAQAAAGRVFRVLPGVETAAAPDPQAARRLITPFLREPGKPIVLAIARPVAKKNLEALISAYANSTQLQAAANLVVLAGQRRGLSSDGSETGRVIAGLFDQVDRADLWGKVALPRKHTAAEVQGLYRLASEGGVFVNPAWHEPFGLTIVEALHHGVPVVATRHGGPAEILNHAGYGRIIDPENTDTISEACLALLSDRLRPQRAEAARKRAVQGYAWSRWAQDVHRIMAGLTTSSRTLADASEPSRLFVSDIDGTLTGSRVGLSRLTNHITRRTDMGFALATGRSISEARRVISEWDIPEPEWLITSVGSEIWRRVSRGVYVPVDAYENRIDRDWCREQILSSLSDGRFQMQPSYEQRAFKLSLFGDATTAKRLEATLRARNLNCRVIASHGRFIDILPENAGKAAAANWLAEYLGLTSQHCVAAGDSGNDRDLLTWAGAAILPANAHSEIADLSGPGIFRSKLRYADGVLDGLEALHRKSRVRAVPRAIAAE